MKTYQKYLLALSLLLAALYTSYWYGKNSNPPKTIVKVEEKIVEKIVTVEVEKKQEKKQTVTKITEKPDGTKETIIEEKKELSFEMAIKKDLDKKTETELVSKTNNLSDYKLGVLVGSKVLDKEKQADLLYSGQASMRVFGPWWLDLQIGFTEKTASFGVSLEF
jgi:hypothetical protein